MHRIFAISSLTYFLQAFFIIFCLLLFHLILSLSVSQHIDNPVRIPVIPGRNLDAASPARRMDDLTIANVHRHMVDRSLAIRIENQIARTHLRRINLRTRPRLFPGHPRQGHARHMAVYILCKTRTIHTRMRVITAPDITVSDKLKGIIDNLGPQGLFFF